MPDSVSSQAKAIWLRSTLRRRAAGVQNAPRIAELEQELDAMRAELRQSARTLAASNDEQRAINEELRSLNSELQVALECQRTTSDDLQHILYSTDVATLFLDRELNIRFFTPATRALFNLIPSDIGRPLEDLHSQAADIALLADARAVLRSSEAIERELEAPNGSWFRRRILPRLGEANGIGGVVITFYDITRRKREAKALEAALLQAELASLAKSRFLAAASHDLRQPLRTLAAVQELLLKATSAKAIGVRASADLVAKIGLTLGAMSAMLNIPLDVDQIEADVVRAEIAAFRIGDLLGRLPDEYADEARAQGLTLHVVPCSLLVHSDPRLLNRMICDLLSNALTYTKRGGVLLGCRRHGAMLSIELWNTGVGDAVCEQGLGLSVVRRLGGTLGHRVRVRSHLGKGPLFAVEVTRATGRAALQAEQMREDGTAKAARRTGTVLAIAGDPKAQSLLEFSSTGNRYCAVAALDGPTALERTEAVQAQHPQYQCTGHPVCEHAAGASFELEPPVIYIVDDDSNVRYAIRAVLENAGQTVEDYSACEAFLEAYRPSRKGCLLIDACLPGMSGFELLQRLLGSGGLLPAIMITGNSDVPMAVQAMKAGAVDLIEKPISASELLASVERALGQARDLNGQPASRPSAAKYVAGLTPRQQQVMGLVLAGHPSKNIAADLGVSQRTVENHRASIMKRMGAKSLPALARLALAAGGSDDSPTQSGSPAVRVARQSPAE